MQAVNRNRNYWEVLNSQPDQPPEESTRSWKKLAVKSLESWESEGKREEAKRLFVQHINRAGNALKVIAISKLYLSTLPPVTWDFTQLITLDLSTNMLETLPSAIGNLTCLRTLTLDENILLSLPTEIGLLKNLLTLSMKENSISTFPTEIGNLANLRTLNMACNKLTSLPKVIGKLSNLITLNLEDNGLTALPSDIGRLVKMQTLVLSSNQLEYLPPEIGACLDLDSISLFGNGDLEELPLTMGGIPGLTTLNILGTSITQNNAAAILDQCRILRTRKTQITLPIRLKTWKRIAHSHLNELHILGLSASQKIDLNEWLYRLEKTRDFRSAQGQLASIVCQIMTSVIENESFKELFFTQIAANNECCEDRAAMALNEIFTAWKINCLPEAAPLTEKLQVMTRCAKAIALRHELSKIIPPNETESVEIYLYYETRLKDHISTAIQQMRYETIGRREWISEDKLLEALNDTYFTHLMALPVFENIAKTALHEEWESIQQKGQTDLDDLGECPEGEPFEEAVLNWQHRQGEVMQNQKEAWARCVKKWYDEQL